MSRLHAILQEMGAERIHEDSSASYPIFRIPDGIGIFDFERRLGRQGLGLVLWASPKVFRELAGSGSQESDRAILESLSKGEAVLLPLCMH